MTGTHMPNVSLNRCAMEYDWRYVQICCILIYCKGIGTNTYLHTVGWRSLLHHYQHTYLSHFLLNQRLFQCCQTKIEQLRRQYWTILSVWCNLSMQSVANLANEKVCSALLLVEYQIAFSLRDKLFHTQHQNGTKLVNKNHFGTRKKSFKKCMFPSMI